MKPTLTATETLSGCVGGGVTGAKLSLSVRSSAGLNCTTFTTTSTKTIMTGTQTMTWNTKTTSSVSISMRASGKKAHLAATITGTVTAGLFKGQHWTQILAFTPANGVCTKTPMGATTVNGSRSNSSF